MKQLNLSSIKHSLPQFIFFTFLFILFTIIGTLSHEWGHILFAKALGYQTELHFAHMEVIEEVRVEFHSFLIFAGGPIQTMLTGTIGYILLRRTNKSKPTKIRKSNFPFLGGEAK